MTGRRCRKELIESSESEEGEEEDSYESGTESDQSASEPEQIFCKCREPNTEDMIGCDGLGCLYEWLHYDCAGVDPKNIPKGKWLCRDCHKKQSEEIPRIPFGQFVWPATNPNNGNNSAKEADQIIESSLNQAEVQHARNLRKACDAVIHRGKSVSNAAQQFSVGRYVLSDYVNDQLKRNLTKACESVLDKTYSLQRAAVVFGVIPAILEERVKAVENKLCTADCRRLDQSVTSTSFEENLKQACKVVVSDELTIDEASKAFKVPLEELQKKLKSVQSVFTTKEENDLVKLCIRLTVLGQIAKVKTSVMSKIKQLLDEEELLGIKRLHSFPNNMPDDCWWESFRKRHPEFKAMDFAESIESKEGMSSQSNSVTFPQSNSGAVSRSNSIATHQNIAVAVPQSNSIAVPQSNSIAVPQSNSVAVPQSNSVATPQSNSVPSNVVRNQFWTQPTNLSEEPSNVRQILPTHPLNVLSPSMLLKPSPPQPVIQNSVWNSNQCGLRPTENTADQVFYILNTPPAKTQQYFLVQPNRPPDQEVTPVTVAGPKEVCTSMPTVLNQPECNAGVSQSLEAQQQNSHHNGTTENLLLTAADNDCDQPSLESGTPEIKAPDGVPAADKITQEDTEVADILGSAQENTEFPEFPGSEVEHLNSVDGQQEVILPSLDVGSNEVVQTDGAVSETTSPTSTFGDHELPQISVVVTDETDGVDPINQVVAKEVVETSLLSPNSAAPSEGDLSTSEALQPQKSIANVQARVAVVVSDALQTCQQTGPNGTNTAAEIVQPKPVSVNIATPRPNLTIPTNLFAQPNVTVVANQVVQARPSYIVQPTPIIVANQVAQPTQVILNKNATQQNPVAKGNQILTQNYVVVQNRMVQSKPVPESPTGAVKPNPLGSMLPDSQKVGIPNKDLQKFLNATGGGHDGTPLVMPMSGNPAMEKPLPQPQAKVFVAKHKVDKSLPDALTCLEKTLTEEQKEAFAFRLQIGDDRQDDAVYNAWRALKRLYHHKNIYSMYDKKSPNESKIPFSYDVPVATKLLKTPLMDPVNYDDRIPNEGDTPSRVATKLGSRVLTELRRGRKRRHITAVLERRERERRGQDARKFLEPWRYRMTMPGKRKRFIARYAEESFPEVDEDTDEDSEESESNSENLDLVMGDERLDDISL